MALPPNWTETDIPDLTGRVAVVTGANSGLGYFTALELSRGGAQVVMACRDAGRAQAAAEQLRQGHPGAAVEVMTLDLASLDSVRRFVDDFRRHHASLDILCNNAGVMAIPRRETAEGFEMQLGTNHLGHFALTGLLLDLLLASPTARIVNVSSTAHKMGRMHFDDLQLARRYSRWGAYGQSKLANLLFTYELQRRLAAAGSKSRVAASHPGYAATNLQAVGPQMAGSKWMVGMMELANRVFAQSAAAGALPTLAAATSPDVEGGDYVGPRGLFETAGTPAKVESSARSHDEAAAARLWEISQELTAVEYGALQAPVHSTLGETS